MVYGINCRSRTRGQRVILPLDITSPLSPEFLFAFENDAMDQQNLPLGW